MAKDETPTPDPRQVTPPELDSETWIRAQENILLFGSTLREIAAKTDDPEIWKLALNSLIRSGMQGLFLKEEL